MTCRGCGRPWCRCVIASTDCITRSGSGNPNDPVRLDVRLDDADTNALQVTRDGLLLQIPAVVSQPIAFSARAGAGGGTVEGPVFSTLVQVEPLNAMPCRVRPMDLILYDTGGLFDTSTNAFTAPVDGLYELEGAADSFDDPEDFAVQLVLDGQDAICSNGPCRTRAEAGMMAVITHIELRAAQYVQLCVASFQDDITLAQAEFRGCLLSL